MKKEKTKSVGKAKKIIGMSALFVGIFGATAAGTFFLIPQEKNIIPAPDDKDAELTGSQKLMQNIVDGVSTNGLGATIKEGIVVLDGKKEGYSNNLDLKDTILKFRMDALNIHGIDLIADAKVNYNNKTRGLGFSLYDDNIYFNITDYDANTWDLKYKVSTKAYDTNETDSDTGGTTQYSYGKLDWLIEDIVNILTNEGVSISFPSISGALKGSSDSSSSEESSESSSGSSIDAQAILDSMNAMTEDKDLAKASGAAYYFNWDLVLGDKTLELGLRADSEYQLTGVDFPRINADGTQDAVEDLVSGMDFRVQLDIATNNLEFGAPADVANYHDLVNSVGLFEKIAHMAGSMKFGVGLDLDLSYETEGEDASIYKFAKDGLNDSAKLTLDANVDGKGMKLNALDADLNFIHTDGETNESKQSISASYLDENSDKSMYLNLNNTLKAKTSKTMLDEVVGSIKGALKSDPVTDSGSASEEQKTEEQVEKTESAIAKAIQAVKDSEFVTGLDNGVYDSALDFIKSITVTDNKIEIVLSLKPIGISTGNDDGKDIVITLAEDKEKVDDPLLTVELNKIQFASFTVDGALNVINYDEVKAPSDKDTYQEMHHLKSVTDQVLDIVDSKKATITLGGGFKFAKESNVGFDIDGKIALDASTKNDLKSGIAIDVTETEEKFTQHHNIKADIAQEEVVDEDETTSEYDTRAFFSYDSFNPEDMSGEHTDPKTNEPIKGTMSVGYMMDTVQNIIEWSNNSLDNRFSRISRAISKPGENALINDLTKGKYFALADLKVIKSFTTSLTQDVIVINASSLGLDKDVTININFNDDRSIKSIDIISTLGKNDTNIIDMNIGLSKELVSSDLQTLDDHTSANYCNYDVVMDMADYAVNTTTLGAIKENDHGQTTLGLKANVDIALGDYTFNALTMDGALSIDGAQLQMAANLNDVPTIKGLNAPENDKYFRGHEYEGSRDASFYYYADGLETNDEVMMTRNSSYGKLRDVKDSVRMSKDIFSDDLGGWLLEYFLGVNSSLLEKDETTTNETTTEETTSYGLPLEKAIHVMDVFHGIKVEEDENSKAKTYVVDLDLAKLGFGFLGTTSLKVGADTVTDDNNNTFKTLTGLNLEVNLALAGKLKVAKAVVDLSITNIVDHKYTNIWNEENQIGYFTYFCPTVGDTNYYGEVKDYYGYVSADKSIDRNYVVGEKGKAGNYYC